MRKKSRWDVSEQEELDKEDELPTSASTASPNSISDQTQAQKRKEDDKEEQQKEEEEEEEVVVSRPPMDLFKAIFASSDDDSSSSEVESEEEDTKEGEGKNDLHPLNLFNVPSTSVTSSITSCSSQKTVVFSQTSMQEEFGPSLPPPSARGGATSHYSSSTEDKQRKKNKEKKVKKKEGKHKKDKKKKKQKKHKHKEKHQKKSKEEESSDEDSEGHVSTEELLKRYCLHHNIIKSLLLAQTPHSVTMNVLPDYFKIRCRIKQLLHLHDCFHEFGVDLWTQTVYNASLREVCERQDLLLSSKYDFMTRCSREDRNFVVLPICKASNDDSKVQANRRPFQETDTGDGKGEATWFPSAPKMMHNDGFWILNFTGMRERRFGDVKAPHYSPLEAPFKPLGL
ncbi:hypothetical protein JOB18_031903 [Solea senegalensis]|uniref:Uncharacterized protein n=1 Tax=Solea senegalensis TaxID=28829 RepID=A0AAV6RPE7_SOLSE|nr:hypothetical protein JOB18_031903 [Solea senegalensis]